jgi:hypothetical protein
MTADDTDSTTGTKSTRPEAPAEAASDAPTGNPAHSGSGDGLPGSGRRNGRAGGWAGPHRELLTAWTPPSP